MTNILEVFLPRDAVIRRAVIDGRQGIQRVWYEVDGRVGILKLKRHGKFWCAEFKRQ